MLLAEDSYRSLHHFHLQLFGFTQTFLQHGYRGQVMHAADRVRMPLAQHLLLDLYHFHLQLFGFLQALLAQVCISQVIHGGHRGWILVV